MKKSTKRLLAGVLAGTTALSMTAYASIKNDTLQSAAITSHGEVTELSQYKDVTTDSGYLFLEGTERETRTLSSGETPIVLETMASAAAYDQFYAQYGYEKAAYVYYNGVELPYTDAFPLIENGATFVPLAVFAEVIGATTDYVAETHSVSMNYNGSIITFDIGDAKFYVNGGEAQDLPYATFVANSRVMVPLRFITDAFGLGLYWNDSYKQVIAVDVDGLKTGISTDYDLMNRFLTYTKQDDTGVSAKLTGDFEYNVKVNGKTMTLNSDLSAISNGDLSSIEYAMDFAVDLSEFETDIRAMLAGMSPSGDDADLVANLLLAIDKFNINYIYDLENLVFYLQSDLIGKLLPIFSLSESLSVTEGTWYKLTLTDFMLDAEINSLKTMMTQLSGQNAVTTMDEFVDMMLTMTRYQDNRSTDMYGMLEMLLSATNDKNFTQNGNAYTLMDSYSQNGAVAEYVLTLLMDEEGDVESYNGSFTFREGSNETMNLYVEQADPSVIDVRLVGLFSGLSVEATGSFYVENSDVAAKTKPSSGDIFDLSTIF